MENGDLMLRAARRCVSGDGFSLLRKEKYGMGTPSIHVLAGESTGVGAGAAFEPSNGV